MNVLTKRTCFRQLGDIIRTVTTGTPHRFPRGYDGEGKTTLHVMNRDEDIGLMIDGYSQVGFKLNNSMTVLGPMIIFPRSVLAWNIGDVADVNEDTLSLFQILEPKTDILIIGTGDKLETKELYQSLQKFSRKYRISLEVLSTESACPTFNFLNAEGRNVVGAMIPPRTVKFTEDDELRTKLRYQNVLER